MVVAHSQMIHTVCIISKSIKFASFVLTPRKQTKKTLLERNDTWHSQTIRCQQIKTVMLHATRTSKVMCHLLKHSNFEGGASYVTLHGDA